MLKIWFEAMMKRINEINNDSLEYYILSNNPTSVYDVERLERQYDQRMKTHGFLRNYN